MVKILTPLNMGSFDLAHRIVVATGFIPKPPGRKAPSPAGGMFIRPFRTCGGKAPLAPLPVKTWQRINQGVRSAGGSSIARIACHSSWTDEPDIAVFSEIVGLAREAGFDGVELDTLAGSSMRPVASILERVQVLLDVWSADRVGIYLAPFCWMRGRDDDSVIGHFDNLLSALNDMELAFVHFAGVVAAGCGDLSTSLLGRKLRAAFRGIVLASGDYTMGHAVAAVAGRWADAIVFSAIAGDELAFMASLKSAASLER